MMEALEEKVEIGQTKRSWLRETFSLKPYLVDTLTTMAFFQPIMGFNELVVRDISYENCADARIKSAAFALLTTRVFASFRDYLAEKVGKTNRFRDKVKRVLVDAGLGLVVGPLVYLGVLYSNSDMPVEDIRGTVLTGTALAAGVGTAVFGRIVNRVRKKFGTLPDYLRQEDSYHNSKPQTL